MLEETLIFNCERLIEMIKGIQGVQQNTVMPGMKSKADKQKVYVRISKLT